MNPSDPHTFMGYRIHIVPADFMPPVLQISRDFPFVSSEFRRKWNAWALERFGRQERVMMWQESAALGGRRALAMTAEMRDRIAAQCARDALIFLEGAFKGGAVGGGPVANPVGIIGGARGTEYFVPVKRAGPVFDSGNCGT